MPLDNSIFHPDFRETPIWWDAYKPEVDRPELPRNADVVIVGAGYTGLAAALDLARNGLSVVLLEAGALGQGASTRNGGQVSASVSGKATADGRDGATKAALNAQIARESLTAFELIEKLTGDLGNAALYARCGRFDAAWTPRHYAGMAEKVEVLNQVSTRQASLVPRDRQRDEIGSDFYAGGMTVSLAGALHPALHYKSLLDAARKAGCRVLAQTAAVKLEREAGRWRIGTADGGDIIANSVLIATNGYTGDLTPGLKRRVVPVASHMIATEELSADLAASLLPRNRVVVDSRRVLYYFRLSPDGRRVLFGGRSRFTEVGARSSGALLHKAMIARFPQLAGTRVTHSWTGMLGFTFDHLPHVGQREGLHYALGCNGSGIAIMAYLGHVAARNILGIQMEKSVFERIGLRSNILYRGNPWFLPPMGGWYRLLDDVERHFSSMK